MVDLAQAAAWHRQVAALALVAGHAGVRDPQLLVVQQRLAAQQARFVQVATMTGHVLPSLMPDPADLTAAGPALRDRSPAALEAVFRTMVTTMDLADRTLDQAVQGSPRLGTWPPAVRNALIYGLYSAGVFALQVVLLFTLDETRALPLLAPVCLLVLPAFAWLGGYLTTGAVFRPGPGAARVDRTPRLGVAISLAPNLLLCVALGVLYLIRS
jgi:hypothetical protein